MRLEKGSLDAGHRGKIGLLGQGLGESFLERGLMRNEKRMEDGYFAK